MPSNHSTYADSKNSPPHTPFLSNNVINGEAQNTQDEPTQLHNTTSTSTTTKTDKKQPQSNNNNNNSFTTDVWVEMNDVNSSDQKNHIQSSSMTTSNDGYSYSSNENNYSDNKTNNNKNNKTKKNNKNNSKNISNIQKKDQENDTTTDSRNETKTNKINSSESNHVKHNSHVHFDNSINEGIISNSNNNHNDNYKTDIGNNDYNNNNQERHSTDDIQISRDSTNGDSMLRMSVDSTPKTSIDTLMPKSLSQEIMMFKRRQYYDEVGSRWRFIPGYELVHDIKRRIPFYFSDWKDGIHPSTIATVAVLFFMSLAPAISIGGLLESKTEGEYGVTEVLLTTAIAGILWPLIAGQPMLIIGVTGPVAVFIVTVRDLAKQFNIPFVPWLGCIGFSSAILHFLLSFFNVIRFVKLVSRFTSEVFAALTGSIFLWQAGEEILVLFKNVDDEPDVLLLSLLVVFGTFWCSTYLEKADQWTVFPRFVTSALSSAAVPIAIIAFSAITYIPPMNSVSIKRLSVPLSFHTTSGRPWVQLSGLTTGQIFASIIPGFALLCLFLFDHNVSSVLTQRREFKLRKGTAYHWDYFVVGIIMTVCGVLSIPYANALIPQSPLHVRQMAKFKEITESSSGSSGDVRKIVIDRVRETRLTGFLQGLLIGVVMLWGQRLLRLIPQGVVIGMFLYFGVSSFYDNEYAVRLKLLITHPSYHHLYRGEHYMQGGVRFSTVVYFTLLQTVMFIGLTAVTLSPISLLFPLFILMFLPFRIYVMPCFFSEQSLDRLDTEIMPDDDDDLNNSREYDQDEYDSPDEQNYDGWNSENDSQDRRRMSISSSDLSNDNYNQGTNTAV